MSGMSIEERVKKAIMESRLALHDNPVAIEDGHTEQCVERIRQIFAPVSNSFRECLDNFADESSDFYDMFKSKNMKMLPSNSKFFQKERSYSKNMNPEKEASLNLNFRDGLGVIAERAAYRIKAGNIILEELTSVPVREKSQMAYAVCFSTDNGETSKENPRISCHLEVMELEFHNLTDCRPDRLSSPDGNTPKLGWKVVCSQRALVSEDVLNDPNALENFKSVMAGAIGDNIEFVEERRKKDENDGPVYRA